MLQLARTGLLTVTALALGWCLLLLCAAIFFVVPVIRVYACNVVPNQGPWLLVTCLVALAAASIAHKKRPTNVTRVLMVVAPLATLLASAVIVRLLYVAGANGAGISILNTLSWRDTAAATPDESRVYARPNSEPLLLDIYYPPGPRAHALSPVLFVVHGGGFAFGSRTLGALNMRWYAAHGWTVISIDYRLAVPGAPSWNLAPRDVECALAWTADHASALHLDMNRLVVSGASAGGSLAMAAAYARPDQRFDPACGPRVPKVAAVVVRVPLVDAAASWVHRSDMQDSQRRILTRYIGGPPDEFPHRYAAVDLKRYMGPNLPPTLIIGGDSDSVVPPAGAIEFTKLAAARGNDIRHVLFPFSGHEFNTTFRSITNQAILQIVSQFLTERGIDPTLPPAKQK